MRSRHSFSTEFIIRKCKGDKTKAMIFARITVDGCSKEISIEEKYRMLEDDGALITAETVKDAYLGIHTLQKGHKLIELTDYYKKIWEPKLKNGGFKNYKTTIEYIKLFLVSKYPGGDIN